MQARSLRALILNPAETALGLVTVAMCVDIIAAVFFRYVIGHSLSFYDELARFLFIWMAFLGCAVAVRRHAHFSVHMFTHRLSPALQRASAVLSCLFVAAFAGLMIVQGLQIVQLTSRQKSPAMEVPMSIFYSAVPVSGVLIIVYLIPQVISLLRGGPLPGSHAEEAEGGS